MCHLNDSLVSKINGSILCSKSSRLLSGVFLFELGLHLSAGHLIESDL